MRKMWLIAIKDVYLVFRDVGAVLLMLVTPFALTVATASAFGSSGQGELHAVPVVIVNQDTGDLGAALVAAFGEDTLANIFDLQVADDPQQAKALVDANKAAAAILIPPDFSTLLLGTAMIPSQGAGSPSTPDVAGGQEASVLVYANPTRPIGASAARSAVATIVGKMATRAVAVRVAARTLLNVGGVSPAELATMSQHLADAFQDQDLIQFAVEDLAGRRVKGFNWLAYMAPSMAIFFLMFTVALTARTVLGERDMGTLPRMLMSPTRPAYVLGGKVLGTFLTGLVQMSVLILASAFIFHIRWGSPLGVGLLVVSLVAAASGWGAVLAAFARTPGQVNAAGSALALVFGIAAGNFIPRSTLPGWLRTVSLISPNAWGLDGFRALAEGGTLADVGPMAAALWGMGAVLFLIAALGFRRWGRTAMGI